MNKLGKPGAVLTATMVLLGIGGVAPAAEKTKLHPCATATDVCTGTIEVPLDWSSPGSERVTINFTRWPRRNTSAAAAGTIMANMGGPAAALPAADTVITGLGPVLDRHDLLVVELRGFAASTALTCEGILADKPETVAPCAEKLGGRAQFFTMDQAVRDHDAVRAALGIPKLAVFGNSYGSVLAQAYATRFPGNVNAIYIDSSLKTDETGYTTDWTDYAAIQAGIAQLDAICEDSAACRDLPGSARARLTALTTAFRSAGNTEDLYVLARLVGRLEHPDVGRNLNAAIHAHLSGDEAPLRRLVDLFQTKLPPALPPLPPSFAAYLSYTCGDGRLPFNRTADPQQRAAELKSFYTKEKPYAPFTDTEVRGRFGSLHELCLHWPTPRHSPPVPAHATYPSVPVLVAGGQLDVSTPPANGRLVAKRFPRGTFIEHAYSAHAAWSEEDRIGGWCQRDTMRGFLTAPARPVARGCQSATYQALGRMPLLVRDIPPASTPDLNPRQRAVLAAAFATVRDAAIYRQPAARPPAKLTGLRGGEITFPQNTSDVVLDNVRYVNDLTISGTIAVDESNRATATLDNGVTFSWPNLDANAVTTVIGTFAGTPFTARLVP